MQSTPRATHMLRLHGRRRHHRTSPLLGKNPHLRRPRQHFEAVLTDAQLATHKSRRRAVSTQFLDAQEKRWQPRRKWGNRTRIRDDAISREGLGRRKIVWDHAPRLPVQLRRLGTTTRRRPAPAHPQRRLRSHRHLGQTAAATPPQLVRPHLGPVVVQPRAHRTRANHHHCPQCARPPIKARARRLRRKQNHCRVAGR